MVTTEGSSEPNDRGQLRRAVIASTIGTTIEWYDFFLYSTVTGLVFAQLYFPYNRRCDAAESGFAIILGAAKVPYETVEINDSRRKHSDRCGWGGCDNRPNRRPARRDEI